MAFEATTLVFEETDGRKFRVQLMPTDTVVWECLCSDAAEESEVLPCDAVEVAPNVVFASWGRRNGEAVSLAANLENHEIYLCYFYGAERWFVSGHIVEASRSPS